MASADPYPAGAATFGIGREDANSASFVSARGSRLKRFSLCYGACSRTGLWATSNGNRLVEIFTCFEHEALYYFGLLGSNSTRKRELRC